jgi:putative copper resistance protein D
VLPLLRFALFTDLMLLFGLPLFGLYGLKGGERRSGAVFAYSRWIGATAALGMVLCLAAWLVLIAGMAGTPVSQIDAGVVMAFTSGGAIGLAFCVRLSATAMALPIGLVPGLPPTARLVLATLAGGIALGSLAWGGHATMADGLDGWVHLLADIAHLLAAGAWIGAIVALLLLAFRDLSIATNRRLAERTLAAFSSVGTLLVATLLVTGMVNVWMLLVQPGIPLWPLDGYCLLLAIKLGAFAGMLLLAAANRWIFAPRIAHGDGGIRAVIALELSLAIAIVMLVAWLGTVAP